MRKSEQETLRVIERNMKWKRREAVMRGTAIFLSTTILIALLALAPQRAGAGPSYS